MFIILNPMLYAHLNDSTLDFFVLDLLISEPGRSLSHQAQSRDLYIFSPWSTFFLYYDEFYRGLTYMHPVWAQYYIHHFDLMMD